MVMTTGCEADDKDIQECLSGNKLAYARIVRRYEADIARQMWRFTRNIYEHEELVQEVFVQAWRSLPSYRADAPLLHWLRKIATRTAYRFWKRKARERKQMADLPDFDAAMISAPEELSASESADLLYCLLERLPVRERTVLTLHYFEDLPFPEVAQRLGWSHILVKVTAYRARKKLQEQLERAGFGRKHEQNG